MANEVRNDSGQTTYIVDAGNLSSRVFEGLNPDQVEQVREIVREEIHKAIKKLIETGVIGS